MILSRDTIYLVRSSNWAKSNFRVSQRNFGGGPSLFWEEAKWALNVGKLNFRIGQSQFWEWAKAMFGAHQVGFEHRSTHYSN